jgi:hypothetical protein
LFYAKANALISPGVDRDEMKREKYGGRREFRKRFGAKARFPQYREKATTR